MKKKTIARIGTIAVTLVILFSILVSIGSSAFGVTASTKAPYLSKFDGDLKTDITQFLDSSVVQKLPSTVKNTDTISLIVDTKLPAIMDAYGTSNKGGTMLEFASSDEAKALMANASAKKSDILSALDAKGIKYKTGADYTTVFSGFEILVTACDFDAICDVIGNNGTVIVGEVYEAADSKLVENTVNFYEGTGIFNSAGFKYQGEGMVIAVLDTGLDYTHSAFSTSNFAADRQKLGLTKEMVASLLAYQETRAEFYMKNVTADDLYVSDKVPFAFDYADGDADVYSLHNNHGTHVSGVIAGKDDVITGVAPLAQIVSMKTFSDVEDSARTSWILSALEDCVLLGVDVINMSLGTACGFSRESDKEAVNGNVYQKIRDAGISLVVAASNSYNSAYSSDKNGNLGLTSNPDTSTVGSPSTYEGAMSVASIDGKKTPYILYGESIVYFVEATNASSDEKDFFEEILAQLAKSEKYKDILAKDPNAAIDLEYVVVPGAGRPADYYGLDVKDKIVLVRRGSTTFEEKAKAAQDKGAAAIIIYNNVSGDIKMNAGTISIPICSISQDDGEMLAASKRGTIRISRTQKSGPFISDFSSWGPAPDLSIKPEITAHGGNILSAVTGGGYDRLSGTSMACPNMAGFIALLRQYVENEYEEIKNMPEGAAKSRAINALVNCLTMSTADIMYNTNGLPYAVRKQGAGLANLLSAYNTTAYIQTYDRQDGSVMDKAKIELGDDRNKTGVYTLKFAINNFGDTTLTYALSATVMTEGVSETKTARGETTVTEEGYLLNGAKFEVISVTNGTKNGNSVTVDGCTVAVVETRITLSDADKQYLDESFENGMYVEGFVMLDAVSGTEIDLNVPYLAFYGDWTKAPLFDTDYFETNKEELDDGISQDDKVMADAYATRPIGGLYSDYVSYLGSYYFQQNPNDKVIAANRDFIALSYSDQTVHSFRFVWAGLLRNAAKMVVTITNDATGEVIFQTEKHDIRKSYGDGGPIYPANIEVEFDTQDYDLPNNAQLSVKIEGFLDYDDDGATTNEKNTFEFPIVIDYQAPMITDCEFVYEYDQDLKKDRLFAKVKVYDNHYAMALNFGYVRLSTQEELAQDPDKTKYRMESFASYLTPVYSTFNGVTEVEFELTDYIYQIKSDGSAHKNTFVVTAYDYALNMATYEIGLPDEYVDFYFEESASETTYLSVNQLYQLNPIVYPNKDENPDNGTNPWKELIEYSTVNFDNASPAVKVVNDKLVALNPGDAWVIGKDPTSGVSRMFKVTVLGPEDSSHPAYKRYDKPVADVFDVVGYKTLKAYYYLSNDERDIGATGDVKMYSGRFNLKMFPSESVQLITNFVPYLDSAKIVYESNNTNIVEIDENGVVTAKAEGFSSVTVKVTLDGKSTFFSETISVEVKKPWIRTGPSLTHYFGLGGEVKIPSDLNLKEIGQYAFSNFDYIDKVEGVDEISDENPNLTKVQFLGENTITKVIIPIGVEKIGPYAFAGLTALEEVVIPYTLEAIEYGAFYGCTNLKTISVLTLDEDGKEVILPSAGADLGNVKLINAYAFQGCDLERKLTLNSACAIGDYAFAGNTSLKTVEFPETLQSVGRYAFLGDTSLENVKVNAELVKYGAYAFAGCTALSKIETVGGVTINTKVIPQGAFYGCKKLTSIVIGKDVKVIGEYAFTNSGVKSFSLINPEDEDRAFTIPDNKKDYILSKDGTELVLVAPTYSGEFKLEGVTSIGIGAFAENRKITKINMPNVTKVGKYAFAECSELISVKLGALTEIGEYAFFKSSITETPNIDNVEYISPYAFAYTNIKNVVIPNGATVGEGAFCENEKLESVTIGDDVVLEMGAFMYNNRLGGRWKMNSYYKNGRNHYYYDYDSPMRTLIIGNNVVIGDSAFMGAADLESMTLGENIVIGNQAFYNCCALSAIYDLNGENVGFKNVVSIGELAFSGDEQYVFYDADATNIMISGANYVFHYYGAKFESIDLSNVESVAMGSFAYNTSLKTVVLSAELKNIPDYLFYGCEMLASINLDKVETIGSNAFANAKSLKNIDLSSATSVGDYAFTLSGVESVILSKNGTDIGEGAFAYCDKLTTVDNLGATKHIAAYAFAETSLKKADLTSAVTIGDLAFKKENTEKNITNFNLEIILGKNLASVGDNPFAFCVIKPFGRSSDKQFNGNPINTIEYTFDITDTVKVINGSLYCKVETGYELITYAGVETNGVVNVADGTVRISSYAFAGTDVVSVKLPRELLSIGHKAFFGCDKLVAVAFLGINAPILEEQLDVAYYNSYDNIPGGGKYEVPLNNGTVLSKDGLGIVEYYMWNTPSGYYYDVLFGANFVNNVGHLEHKPVMIKPANGEGYDTFMYAQYFSSIESGTVAPTDDTLAAIAAIKNIPNDFIQLSDEELVIAARKAYDKIKLPEQQALISMVEREKLANAEDTIARLKEDMEADNGNTDDNTGNNGSQGNNGGTTNSGSGTTTDSTTATTKPSTDTTDSTVPSADAVVSDNGGNSSTVYIVIIVIMAVLLVGAGVFMAIYMGKKKK